MRLSKKVTRKVEKLQKKELRQQQFYATFALKLMWRKKLRKSPSLREHIRITSELPGEIVPATHIFLGKEEQEHIRVCGDFSYQLFMFMKHDGWNVVSAYSWNGSYYEATVSLE